MLSRFSARWRWYDWLGANRFLETVFYTGDEEEGCKPSQLESRCWVRRETANSQPFVNEEMLLPQGSD